MGTWTAGLFASVFLAFLLGETLVPPYTQRAFSTPDPANARKGYVMSGIFAFFFFFVSASIGLVALALYPNISPDQAVPTVVKNVVPVGLVGLVVAALLAVVMSTASSYLNSIAVVFVKDVYQPFIDPNVSASRKVWLERGLSIVVGGAAILFAVSVPSIVDALLYSYALWAPTVIIPLILAVMWGFRSEAAALSAIVAGGGVAAVWTWVLGEPFGITGLVAGLVVNVVTFAVVYKVAGGERRSIPVAVSEGK
jgi:SSS family solute:Na+ symporter